MKVKDGELLELRLNLSHGERSFPETVTRLQPLTDERHRDWVSLQISKPGKHRGVPDEILFEVDLPIPRARQPHRGHGTPGPRPGPLVPGRTQEADETMTLEWVEEVTQ